MSMLIPIRDLNPTRRFPLVTVIIIGLNVIAFFGVAHGLGIDNRAAFQYGAVPCDVTNNCPAITAQLQQAFPSRSPVVSLFTSIFMHADILHLGFNMLFLWVFGNNVEDRMGRIRFPIFYLSAGIIASLAHIVFSSTSQVPTIGASGAISGVLGGYLLLWPGATVIALVPLGFFFFSTRLPAWVMLGIWFVIQLLGGAVGLGQTGQSGGVAYLAHLGGFVAGMVLIYPFLIGKREDRVDLDWP